jgi:hypothetical protein
LTSSATSCWLTLSVAHTVSLYSSPAAWTERDALHCVRVLISYVRGYTDTRDPVGSRWGGSPTYILPTH